MYLLDGLIVFNSYKVVSNERGQSGQIVALQFSGNGRLVHSQSLGDTRLAAISITRPTQQSTLNGFKGLL
jgi:hypothetical protein